jgi:hypothetical protein
MRPERNGVGLLDYNSNGPYKLWDADKWRCPKCGHEIVVGFGERPVAHHFEEHFKAHVARYRRDELIENHEYLD